MTKFWVIATVILFGGLNGLAQKDSPIEKDSLLIGAGDQISIQVLEAPDLLQHVRVTDAGTVSLVVGGQVKVSGLTPAQAASEVEKALKAGDYVLNPHVAVVVDQYATGNVTVMGQVARPGTFPIGTPRSVIDVLALAGGETELGDRHITIERHGGGERVQYFLSNQADAALDSNSNAKVYPGDIVMVPKINVVYVMGDVPRPGGYPMSTNDGKLSLMQAVAMAGTQEPHALQDRTHLIRKKADGSYAEMQIALGKMEKGKMADLVLQPDDIIYIPFSYIKNMGYSMSALLSSAGSAAIYRY